MIPRAYITAWRKQAPWPDDGQVEQDLIISRCLVEIFNDPALKAGLIFRGGTALHKLYFHPPIRYSEDIDLVQSAPGPIGPIFDTLRKSLAFLGEPAITQRKRNNTLVFTCPAEMPPPENIKIKVEINCREHEAIYKVAAIKYKLDNPWYTRETRIPVYSLPELLGTKLRALYQRKKGRDLFDLWYALTKSSPEVPGKTITVFKKVMEAEGHPVTRRVLKKNLEAKIHDRQFRDDTRGLLRNEVEYDIDQAYRFVRQEPVEKLD